VPPTAATAGVGLDLAAERAERVADLRYALDFSIPGTRTEPIEGRAQIAFTLRGAVRPLVLDFAPGLEKIARAEVNGRDERLLAGRAHVVVPSAHLREGPNTLDLWFTAGDASLNRGDEFMYTLFVPSRAHLAFPCFDQPSLKATFALTLEYPEGWAAVANGVEIESATRGGRTRAHYAETRPLATYLFAFAAGKFSIETAERGGRTFRMFHRETDPIKITRNRDAIFDLHASALAWLEQYTGIPYPWGKFDFFLVPAFQFGGMEHAGAIFYNAPPLLLEESATKDQHLGRASVIAHETAHMWFGDLVTMRWFDDVWMKEVFANFMAAKIVNPSFPEVNHDLRFLYAHYPAAYEVDRTTGANPIRQPLDNLDNAGTLYGAIIYQKAPTVMRQLELILGEDGLRDGLREYLKTFAFGNASWPDLVSLLDARTPEDLAAWSRAWVDEPGRPTIRTVITQDEKGQVTGLALEQSDPRGRALRWPQRLTVSLGYPDGVRHVPVRFQGRRIAIPGATGQPRPQVILPNGGGLAYGRFEIDSLSRTYLLAKLPEVDDPLTRGSAWVTLWDALLEGQIAAAAFVDLALRALPRETDELTVQRVLGYLGSAVWRYLPERARTAIAPDVERVIREGLDRATTPSQKGAWFQALRGIALTPDTLAWLERVWRKQETIAGLTLAESDYTALALELAVREVPAWEEILRTQLDRIDNPDRKARFAFVRPALSADSAVRDAFFASLASAENRRREPWVLEAVRYLHHPLRADASAKYVLPSLELLAEIQRTGDIFFPKRWLDVTLGGHRSRAVADVVRQFLASRPAGYPARLRNLILQSSDELYRASRLP
jgi:aminopeptidase N